MLLSQSVTYSGYCVFALPKSAKNVEGVLSPLLNVLSQRRVRHLPSCGLRKDRALGHKHCDTGSKRKERQATDRPTPKSKSKTPKPRSLPEPTTHPTTARRCSRFVPLALPSALAQASAHSLDQEYFWASSWPLLQAAPDPSWPFSVLAFAFLQPSFCTGSKSSCRFRARSFCRAAGLNPQVQSKSPRGSQTHPYLSSGPVSCKAAGLFHQESHLPSECHYSC